MMFYRLEKADFADTLEKAWSVATNMCDKKESNLPAAALNLMDGRAYQMSVRAKKIN